MIFIYVNTTSAYFDARCCVAIAFESRAVDPRTGNTLKSPEFSLSSDRELSFTMALLPYTKYCTVHVYKTSILGRISSLLGSSSRSASSSLNDWDVTDVNHTMCLPAGTYKLVFYASQPADVATATAAIRKVQLTESSCTYTPPEGRPASKKLLASKLSKCFYRLILSKLRYSYAVHGVYVSRTLRRPY